MDKEQQHGLQKPVIVQPLRKSLGCQTLDQQEAGYNNISVSKKSNLCDAYLIYGNGVQKIGKHLAEGRGKGFGKERSFLQDFQMGLSKGFITPWLD